MKRFILIIALSILLIPSVLAQKMYQFNTTVNVNEDGSSNFKIDFKFPDDLKTVEIPLNGKITDLRAENGNCEIIEQVGQVISCEPLSPFVVGTIRISADFNVDGLVQKRGNISFFSLDVPILWDTDELFVKVTLPEKTALAEKVLLPISPSGVDMTFDGRRVITNWHFFNKKSGDIIPIRIYYEPLTYQPIQISYTWAFLIVIIVIVISVGLVYRKISYKKSELVFSVLNESERIVVDIIKKEKKEIVDQREIVRQSGFSKAKISRIIQSLEERGIIESERTGRKNKIKLKKQFIEK
jgi:uncharacterized membrane protein